MTRGRIALTVFAGFLVSQVLTGLIHGFVLAADYAPFYGSLLRPREDAGSGVLLLLVIHLMYVSALVWVYSRLRLGGSTMTRGLALGVFGFVINRAPEWMHWYVEQPWPGTLLPKQLALELVSSLLVGLTIAAVARKQD